MLQNRPGGVLSPRIECLQRPSSLHVFIPGTRGAKPSHRLRIASIQTLELLVKLQFNLKNKAPKRKHNRGQLQVNYPVLLSCTIAYNSLVCFITIGFIWEYCTFMLYAKMGFPKLSRAAALNTLWRLRQPLAILTQQIRILDFQDVERRARGGA